MSPNNYHLVGSGGKHVSACEKARKLEQGISSDSKSKVRKVESDQRDSVFESYDDPYDNLDHKDVDKEATVSSQQERKTCTTAEEI